MQKATSAVLRTGGRNDAQARRRSREDDRRARAQQEARAHGWIGHKAGIKILGELKTDRDRMAERVGCSPGSIGHPVMFSVICRNTASILAISAAPHSATLSTV